MTKKHFLTRVPIEVKGELDNIMKEEQFSFRTDAFRKMVEHSRIGREVEILSGYKTLKRFKK